MPGGTLRPVENRRFDFSQYRRISMKIGPAGASDWDVVSGSGRGPTDHASTRYQVQRNRPQRSRQHRRHPMSKTSPLRLLSTSFESGTTCIAVALVEAAAARTNPA